MVSLRFRIVFVFSLLISYALTAQNDYHCFRVAVDSGLRSMDDNKQVQAVKQFLAAYDCDAVKKDSLHLLIQQATAKLEQAIEKAESAENFEREQKEIEALLRARAEKESAEKEAALIRARAAESEAVMQEQATKLQGQRAESRRLIELVNKRDNKENFYEALIMTLAGMELGGSDVYESGMRVFGTLVRDSFTEVVYTSEVVINELAMLPKENKLLVVGEREVSIFDCNKKKVLTSIKPQVEKMTNYCIAPKSSDLVFWSENDIHRWNIEGLIFNGQSFHSDEIFSAIYSPNENYLITLSRDKTAVLYPLMKDTLPMILNGHNGPVYDAKFSPNHKHLLTRSTNDLVIVWTVTGEKLAELGGGGSPIYDAGFNGTGDRIITASGNGEVKVWDLNGNEMMTFNDHSKAVRQVDCFPNPNTIISRSTNAIKSWDENGMAIPISKEILQVKGMQLNHQKDAALVWTGVKPYLFLLHPDATIASRFKGLETNIGAAAFSKNDQFILTSGKDYSTQLWDKTGQLLISWASLYQYPLCAIFSEDSQYVYILSSDRKQILRCPMTTDVYEEMKSKSKTMNAMIHKIKSKYGLEFLAHFTD